MSLVIDSFITLSWYFADERTPASKAILLDGAEHGAVAPSLWRLEVANGFATAIRRKRVDKSYREDSLADLVALDVTIDADTHSYAWSAILELAARHGLTVYDASYLELALRRALPLATLDRALRNAAEMAGVKLRGAAD